MIRHAQRQQLIARNPVELISQIRAGEDVKTRVPCPWPRDKAMTALATVKQRPETDLFIHLGRFCGMRYGEILGLAWNAVDSVNVSIGVCGRD